MFLIVLAADRSNSRPCTDLNSGGGGNPKGKWKPRLEAFQVCVCLFLHLRTSVRNSSCRGVGQGNRRCFPDRLFLKGLRALAAPSSLSIVLSEATSWTAHRVQPDLRLVPAVRMGEHLPLPAAAAGTGGPPLGGLVLGCPTSSHRNPLPVSPQKHLLLLKAPWR